MKNKDNDVVIEVFTVAYAFVFLLAMMGALAKSNGNEIHPTLIGLYAILCLSLVGSNVYIVVSKIKERLRREREAERFAEEQARRREEAALAAKLHRQNQEEYRKEQEKRHQQQQEQERVEEERRQNEIRQQELVRRQAAEEQAAREAAARQREQERFNRARKVRRCTGCERAYPEYLSPSCPWCKAESGQLLEAVYNSVTPANDDLSSVPELATFVEQKEQLGDFVGGAL